MIKDKLFLVSTGQGSYVTRKETDVDDYADAVGVYVSIADYNAMQAWHQAVLNACMSTETCYQENDPEGSVNRLINWHIENERFHVDNQDEIQQPTVIEFSNQIDIAHATTVLNVTFSSLGDKLER